MGLLIAILIFDAIVLGALIIYLTKRYPFVRTRVQAEKSISKLVAQTASITTGCVVALFLVVILVITMLSPVTLAKVSDSLGNYNVSAWLYKRQYDISDDDINALSDLVFMFDDKDEEHLGRYEYYAYKLIYHKDFDDFCSDRDAREFKGAKKYVSTKESVFGAFCVVAYKNEGIKYGVDAAVIYYNQCGYTEFNPIRMMLIDLGEVLSLDDLLVIENTLTEIKGELTDTSIIDLDLKEVNRLKSLKSI